MSNVKKDLYLFLCSFDIIARSSVVLVDLCVSQIFLIEDQLVRQVLNSAAKLFLFFYQ